MDSEFPCVLRFLPCLPPPTVPIILLLPPRALSTNNASSNQRAPRGLVRLALSLPWSPLGAVLAMAPKRKVAKTAVAAKTEADPPPSPLFQSQGRFILIPVRPSFGR